MTDPLDQNSESRLNDEDLLAWILNQPNGLDAELELPGSAGQANSAQLAERMQDLQGFIGQCRLEATEDNVTTDHNSEFLARRIVSETVQEDVSVRADWGLVRGFVRNRLAASGLLRIVAASLLLHMGALPVMAYYVWVRPKPTSVVTFLPLPQVPDLPFQEVEPEAFPELDLSLGSVLGLDDELAAVSEIAQRHGEISHTGQVSWSDDLGLVLEVERLLSVVARTGATDQDHSRLPLALKAMGECLERLKQKPDLPALRRLVASAWFRAQGADLGAYDAPFSWDSETARLGSELHGWLATPGPLTGLAWQEACEKAEAELLNKGK